MADEYDDSYTGSRRPYAPYQQGRSALRRKFGSRAIDASALPSAQNSKMSNAGVGAMGGKTQAHNWTSFFRPPTPAPTPTVAPLIEGVPVHGVTPPTPWSAAPEGSFAPSGYEGARTPIPVSPALAPAPVNYLKSAFDKATQFVNAQGGRTNPIAGSVQAGTSFRNRFGTGSVASASETKLKRLLRDTPMPEFFDLRDA